MVDIYIYTDTCTDLDLSIYRYLQYQHHHFLSKLNDPIFSRIGWVAGGQPVPWYGLCVRYHIDVKYEAIQQYVLSIAKRLGGA